MRPKGKLFALFAVFAAIGLITASGAFTTVQAERTVAVDTAGDANALLGLEGNSSGNGEYVDTENDQLLINLTEPASQGADGVNLNATTEIYYMINVSNQGDQPIDFHTTVSNVPSEYSLTFYNGTSENIVSSGNSTTIGSGEQISIGLKIETDDSASSDNLNATVTFHANSQ